MSKTIISTIRTIKIISQMLTKDMEIAKVAFEKTIEVVKTLTPIFISIIPYSIMFENVIETVSESESEFSIQTNLLNVIYPCSKKYSKSAIRRYKKRLEHRWKNI